MSTTGVSQIQVLNDLREQAQAEVDRCQRLLDETKRAHSIAVERLSHIQALVELDERANGGGQHLLEPNGGPQRDGGGLASDSRAVDAAFALLQAQGHSLHYREIYSEIERQGILIRGANPANTLLTRMLRDGRFRPAGARGYYELDSDGAHKHFRATRLTKKAAS